MDYNNYITGLMQHKCGIYDMICPYTRV